MPVNDSPRAGRLSVTTGDTHKKSDRDRQDERRDEGRGRETERAGQTLREDLAHGLARRDRGTEVTAGHVAQVSDELGRHGLVEPELRTSVDDQVLVRAGPQCRADRIAGDELQHREAQHDQRGDRQHETAHPSKDEE